MIKIKPTMTKSRSNVLAKAESPSGLCLSVFVQFNGMIWCFNSILGGHAGQMTQLNSTDWFWALIHSISAGDQRLQAHTKLLRMQHWQIKYEAKISITKWCLSSEVLKSDSMTLSFRKLHCVNLLPSNHINSETVLQMSTQQHWQQLIKYFGLQREIWSPAILVN